MKKDGSWNERDMKHPKTHGPRRSASRAQASHRSSRLRMSVRAEERHPTFRRPHPPKVDPHVRLRPLLLLYLLLRPLDLACFLLLAYLALFVSSLCRRDLAVPVPSVADRPKCVAGSLGPAQPALPYHSHHPRLQPCHHRSAALRVLFDVARQQRLKDDSTLHTLLQVVPLDTICLGPCKHCVLPFQPRVLFGWL